MGINSLHTNLYPKNLVLQKTKTYKIDAHTIAMMVMSDVNLKSYADTLYHNEELKSLTRYRFDKVKEWAKLKQSVARFVNILFPRTEKFVFKWIFIYQVHYQRFQIFFGIYHSVNILQKIKAMTSIAMLTYLRLTRNLRD